MAEDRKHNFSPEQIVKGTAFEQAMRELATEANIDTETVFAACFSLLANQVAFYCDKVPSGKDVSIGLCRNVEHGCELVIGRVKKMRRQLENGEPFEVPK